MHSLALSRPSLVVLRLVVLRLVVLRLVAGQRSAGPQVGAATPFEVQARLGTAQRGVNLLGAR